MVVVPQKVSFIDFDPYRNHICNHPIIYIHLPWIHIEISRCSIWLVSSFAHHGIAGGGNVGRKPNPDEPGSSW